MKFDISEMGAIQCQLNFDEDYYPYSHPETLYVSVDRLYGKLAAYSPNKKLLKINELFLGLPDDKLLEVLMHELTHWVNDIESSGKN